MEETTYSSRCAPQHRFTPSILVSADFHEPSACYFFPEEQLSLRTQEYFLEY